MAALAQILPGTGRGTMRSMVEGDLPKRHCLPHAPSTTSYAGGPPPLAGEDR
jgi:hypothetical protein